MPKRILNDEQQEEMARKLINREIDVREAMQIYNICEKTVSKELKKARDRGKITPKDYASYLTHLGSDCFNRIVKAKGGRRAFEIVCKNPEWYGRLSETMAPAEAAMVGFLARSILHGRPNSKYAPQTNLSGPDSLIYDSRGERFLALLLKDLGLIQKLVPEENFRKHFGKKVIDFYIEGAGLQKEPIMIQNGLEGLAREGIILNKKEINPRGYPGILLIARKIGRMYSMLQEMGIDETREQYIDRIAALKKRIDEFDGAYK